ncbi:NAD(P)-dependent alcohol dehydrogenase [Mycolicibacterium sp.]|uniref:NAD(P)-dependent alcohol dehydrogenase n=1 Tax=Mycolicibacterium sp. TaxID=2320850 RepID=UPI003D10D500
MQTTAAVARDADGPFSLETIDIGPIQPDEVLVKIRAVGLCHSDLVLKSRSSAPTVFGHEGAGVIVETGAEVGGISVGDSVLLSFAHCGACPQCTSGHPAYCAEFVTRNMGGTRPDGSTYLSAAGEPIVGSFFGQSSFAGLALAKAHDVIPVPAGTDLTLAAPLGCGLQTGAGVVVNVLAPGPDSSLVVFGVGGVGIAAVMAAAALGVETIVAVDLNGRRREVARTVGATHAIDGAAGDVAEQIRDITGGGNSHTFDTTGVPGVIETALAALGKLGTLVVVGATQGDVTINYSDLVGSGKAIRGCIEGDAVPRTFIPRLLDWHAQGRFPIEKIVTTYPFEDINTAVADSISGQAIKPVLVLN